MDLYQYVVWLLNEMHRKLDWQTNMFSQIEKDLARIHEQLARLEALPRTNVEKIEYNFEQLKVERLDGKLIIGISSSDEGTIDDLDVQNCHSEDVSLGEQTAVNPYRQIRDNICRYIQKSVPDMLDKQAQERNIELSNADKELILEDLIRQMDDRISVYVQHLQGNQVQQEGTFEHNVLQKLKRDVHAALDLYLNNFRRDEES